MIKAQRQAPAFDVSGKFGKVVSRVVHG
jgi:hypothetical protein